MKFFNFFEHFLLYQSSDEIYFKAGALYQIQFSGVSPKEYQIAL